MQVECNKCGLKDKGSYKKLLKKGWKFYFFKEKGLKVIFCPRCCSPTIKDKIKSFFNKNYESEMYKEIGNGFDKLKILYSLKSKEEKWQDAINKSKRIRKKRNHSRMRGSKNRSCLSGRG